MEDRNFLIRKIDKNHYQINSKDTIIIDETGDSIPMVSVTMITYNHEKFIAQAIEGVLMQQTNFKVVLVIGEDCGTDQTRQIILEYQKKYPDKIILKLPEKNLGMMENSISNKMFCNGKYIAECEGDDYWTDPQKLQKQVDVLEENLNCMICYHNSKTVDADNNIISDSYLNQADKINFAKEDLIKGAHIITSSAVFRNVIKVFPSQFFLVLNGDTFMFSLLGNFGYGLYLDETMSNYRIHSAGIWSNNSRIVNAKHAQNTFYQLYDYYKSVNQTDSEEYFYTEYLRLSTYIKSFESQSNDSLVFKMKKKIKLILKRIKFFRTEYF